MRGKVTADAYSGLRRIGGMRVVFAMRVSYNVDDAICEGKPLRGDGNHLLTITPGGPDGRPGAIQCEPLRGSGDGAWGGGACGRQCVWALHGVWMTGR